MRASGVSRARYRAGLTVALLSTALTHVVPPSVARAGGPLGKQGTPITTSSYSIDLFEGPVLASSRVTALGGANLPIAREVEGLWTSPAAAAVRAPWSYGVWDQDLDFGLSFPTTLSKTDYDNNGTAGTPFKNFIFVTLGGNLQFGPWGAGISVDSHEYKLPASSASGTPIRSTFLRGRLALARSFDEGQLMFGVGFRFATLSIESPQGTEYKQVFNTGGAGFDLGVIWGPTSLPIRAAMTVRTPVNGKVDPKNQLTPPDANGDVVIGGRFLPSRVDQPFEVEAGVAFQIGPRALNFSWTSPVPEERALTDRILEARARRAERRREAWLATGADPAAPMPAFTEEERATWADEDRALLDVKRQVRRERKARYLAVPRRKLLVVTSLLVSGSVAGAVGIESFFSQRVDRSGQRTSFTPRLGLEAEPWHDVLQMRLGSYLEPSRFSYGSPRIHGTTGFDVRFFPWTMFGLFDDDTWWRVGGFLDGARDYVGFGGSFGVWH